MEIETNETSKVDFIFTPFKYLSTSKYIYTSYKLLLAGKPRMRTLFYWNEALEPLIYTRGRWRKADDEADNEADDEDRDRHSVDT